MGSNAGSTILQASSCCRRKRSRSSYSHKCEGMPWHYGGSDSQRPKGPDKEEEEDQEGEIPMLWLKDQEKQEETQCQTEAKPCPSSFINTSSKMASMVHMDRWYILMVGFPRSLSVKHYKPFMESTFPLTRIIGTCLGILVSASTQRMDSSRMAYSG